MEKAAMENQQQPVLQLYCQKIPKRSGTKMKETVIWNHERMPIIDGMPASVPDGQPHTPEPWEES
jgi:hypothetical protein